MRKAKGGVAIAPQEVAMLAHQNQTVRVLETITCFVSGSKWAIPLVQESTRMVSAKHNAPYITVISAIRSKSVTRSQLVLGTMETVFHSVVVITVMDAVLPQHVAAKIASKHKNLKTEFPQLAKEWN